MKLGYTTIMHEPRLKLGLSLEEYCILDMVYRLSTNPSAPVAGWCSMSKTTMSHFMGVSRRSIFNALKKLEEEGFITKSSDGRLIKTTQKWIKNVVNFEFRPTEDLPDLNSETIIDTDGANSALGSDTDGAKVALGGGAKVAPYNNIYKNNRERGALAFLKDSFPQRFETAFLMPFKSKIREPQKFADSFDDTVECEKLPFDDALFGRLRKYARSWIANQDKYNPAKSNENQGPNYLNNAI